MKVTVTPCWSGGHRYHWRLEAKGFNRLTVVASDPCWSRREASACLDTIEYNWGVSRRNVRFC